MERQMKFKPITVARQEFVDTMTELINGTHLPYFVIEEVLRKMYSDVTKLSAKQYEIDLQAWQNSVNAAQVTTVEGEGKEANNQ